MLISSRRPGFFALAPLVATAMLLVACAGHQAYDPGARPPWLRAGVAAADQEAGAPPLPRLKPPPDRRHAALAAAGRHLVLPGDTLSGVAERYGVPIGELARINRLGPPYAIQVGQVLAVGPPRPEPRPAPEQHVVRSGESLSILAQRYGVGLGDLARANGLERLDAIRVGQVLRIPQHGEPATAGEVHLVGGGDPLPSSAADDGWRKAVVLPGDDGEGFLWPVNGQVVSSFGPKRSGRRNDGINIAARAGTPVRAAADGVVVYVGDGFRGYGQMVLLRHADGYTTAYAHNSAVLVRENQPVQRGEVIARVGATGAVKEPQLHFELRRNGGALNPQEHLRRTTTVASSAN